MGREIFEGHEVFKSIPYDETPMPTAKKKCCQSPDVKNEGLSGDVWNYHCYHCYKTWSENAKNK